MAHEGNINQLKLNNSQYSGLFKTYAPFADSVSSYWIKYI